MGSVLDLTPGYANVVAYAGDTASITVLTNPADYADGAIWSAQVRASPGSQNVLEVFSIEVVDGGACLTLTPEQTDYLCDMGAVTRAQGCRVHQVLKGSWDVQILFPDGNVQTLARGDFRVERDVTRDD